MAKGYISINRAIEDNWLWKEKPFSKGQAWIDLIMLANHTEVKKPIGDNIMVFQKGCVYRSLSFLADRWGWDRRTVRRFLNVLKSDGMLSLSVSKHGTTISLINYGKYQTHSTTDGTTDSTTDGTTACTQTIITNNYQTLPNARKRAVRANQKMSDEEMWEKFLEQVPVEEGGKKK